MKIHNQKLRFITVAAIVAGLYVALTGVSFLFGLDKSVVQIRISEALAVLPFYSLPSVPGLFIGCFLSGILFAATPVDIITGSVVTLLSAYITYYIGKRSSKKFLACIPPIVLNTAVIPFVLAYSYHTPGLIIFSFIGVFTGESVSAGILGTLLLYKLPKKIIGVLNGENYEL